MRTLEARLTSPLGFAAVIAAVMLAWTVAFSGGVAAGNDNGNNGTVKIHNADEPTPGVQNEPKVCPGFHLHFFFGDGGQTGRWELYSWPGGTLEDDDDYEADANGEAVETPNVGPGTYKLFWGGDVDKHAKQKVFTVEECEAVGGGTG